MRTLIAVLAAILVFSLCYGSNATGLRVGDVNGDCRVNLLDAIELLQGRIPCEQDCSCCPELGDVNGDGQVDELDGVYLLYHFFNHIPLPSEAVDVQLAQERRRSNKMDTPL